MKVAHKMLYLSIIIIFIILHVHLFIASQMMTLVRLLPLLIGNFVNEDDDHWECFCILWAISDMVCTFEVHPDDPACLAWLVQVYLESFTRIYPDISVTPKMHYLVHLPQQMVL